METIFLKEIKSLNIDLSLLIDVDNGMRPAFTINGNCYTVDNNWTTEPILSMQNLISELYNKGKTLHLPNIFRQCRQDKLFFQEV